MPAPIVPGQAAAAGRTGGEGVDDASTRGGGAFRRDGQGRHRVRHLSPSDLGTLAVAFVVTVVSVSVASFLLEAAASA